MKYYLYLCKYSKKKKNTEGWVWRRLYVRINFLMGFLQAAPSVRVEKAKKHYEVFLFYILSSIVAFFNYKLNAKLNNKGNLNLAAG